MQQGKITKLSSRLTAVADASPGSEGDVASVGELSLSSSQLALELQGDALPERRQASPRSPREHSSTRRHPPDPGSAAPVRLIVAAPLWSNPTVAAAPAEPKSPSAPRPQVIPPSPFFRSPAGGDGSAVSTPLAPHRYGGFPRVSSTGAWPGPAAVGPTLRTSNESAMLTAVRRQLDGLEEKLGQQITRAVTLMDQKRDLGIARLEEKVAEAVTQLPKVDRRLAELMGNYKGLSDEMQCQIRRADSMDERLWEWRHQLEEEFRQKYAEMEQQFQKVASANRLATATSEEGLKKYSQKLARLEHAVDRLTARGDETGEGFMQLHHRLEAVESDAMQALHNLRPTAVAAAEVEAEGIGAPEFALMEQRLRDAADRIERITHDGHDTHVRLEAQEERLRTIRTMLEANSDQLRSITERLGKNDRDRQMEHVLNLRQGEVQNSLELQEMIEMAMRRLDHQEQSHEHLLHLHSELMRGAVFDEPPAQGDDGSRSPVF